MTTPTQAQIEAAAKAIMPMWGNELADNITLEGAKDVAITVLTAAAIVGEPDDPIETNRRNATIERCAQVAEGFGISVWCEQIAAAIRALKDKPQIDRNLVYPGKDPDFVFPEES